MVASWIIRLHSYAWHQGYDIIKHLNDIEHCLSGRECRLNGFQRVSNVCTENENMKCRIVSSVGLVHTSCRNGLGLKYHVILYHLLVFVPLGNWQFVYTYCFKYLLWLECTYIILEFPCAIRLAKTHTIVLLVQVT